jgi:hypothetical protein
MIRLALSATFLILISSANVLAASQSPWLWSASYLLGIRNGYVFSGSNSEKVSQLGLLSGNDFAGAGRSARLRPWGMELEGNYRLSELGGPFLNFRIVPFGLQVPGGPEQTGLDWFATLGYRVLVVSKDDTHIGFRVSLRARRWEIEDGPIPDSGHAGLGVEAFAELSRYFASVEAGLTAFNFGTPTSLGLPRDSSTLRLRGGYRFEFDSVSFVPALEFFHTHRNFYASSLIAGESAVFIDEVSLALILGIAW